MRPHLAIFLFLLISITGCKSKSAFNYSQKLVEIEKSLVPDITNTQKKLEQFFGNGEFDSAKAVCQGMEEKIDNKMKMVEGMDAPKVAEAENFKRAYLKYFAYIKSLYTVYKDFSAQTSEEKREEVRQEMVKIEGRKQEAVTDMQEAQKKYAKANGFRLEDK